MGHLKTEFYTIAVQLALGTLHNACKLKLPLVTGAFGTDITEFYMFKEICSNSGDAKAMKSNFCVCILTKHFKALVDSVYL